MTKSTTKVEKMSSIQVKWIEKCFSEQHAKENFETWTQQWEHLPARGLSSCASEYFPSPHAFLRSKRTRNVSPFWRFLRQVCFVSPGTKSVVFTAIGPCSLFTQDTFPPIMGILLSPPLHLISKVRDSSTANVIIGCDGTISKNSVIFSFYHNAIWDITSPEYGTRVT